MSYIDRHLLPGESVTFRTRLHWILYLGPALLSLGVFVPLAVVAIWTDHRAIAVVPLLVIAIAIGAAWVRQRSSEFAVTNKRVILKSGVLQTRSVELLLPKIEGIGVNQGVGGKLLGYGEIVVTGSGGTKEQFSRIRAPLDFRRAVQAATDGGTRS
jgi:uncharacterized membrane protein YdbT with pleckstrin-like domain